MQEIKSVYFVGAGGIGMSALERYFLHNGIFVGGYDKTPAELTERLREEGAQIHYEENVDLIPAECRDPQTTLVVYTPAIPAEHKELVWFRENGFEIHKRAQVLGTLTKQMKGLCVAGTHGKTTTTAMLSYIFLAADLDPTISIGAHFKKIHGNVRIGHSEAFLAEACEYTNSFLALRPLASIILNIEEDHLDFFKDLQDIRNSFHQFVLNTSSEGALIIHSQIDHVEEIVEGYHGQVIQFGLNKGDLCAKNIQHLRHGGNQFEVWMRDERLGSIELPTGGKHNITNALAAIGVAISFGVPFEAIQQGLKEFEGADRRFEKKGFYQGAEIVDDYAHHPQEIQATLNMAKDYPHQRLIMVFQPHTYSRTKFLFEEFAEVLSQVDQVVLAPIYAAREIDDGSISSDLLAKRINELKGNAVSLGSFVEIKDYLKKQLQEGDLCLTVGAGNVYEIGEELIQES